MERTQVHRRTGGLESSGACQFARFCVHRRTGGLENLIVYHVDYMNVHRRTGGLEMVDFATGALWEVNRPGFELTPRSWTVAVPPVRRCFSADIPPG